MKILVWGLGYVGSVTAACLAELGHDVVGIEPNKKKVQDIQSGRSAIKEPGLDELIAKMVKAGKLRVTTECGSFLRWADVSLICVGTPSAANGSSVLDFVEKVGIEIGQGLKKTTRYHVVVLRSTVFPGITRNILLPLLQKNSGKRLSVDFGVVSNPEFLRETSAIEDFRTPPYTVIGELDRRSGEVIHGLYQNIDAPIHHVALEEAELLKLVNNAFHALKIGFANEIGRVCDRLGLDSHKVMALVCADKKLNISPTYLRPGFAFGGSCLPKDIRSLTFNARRLGAELPILEAVLPSNRLQVEAARLKVHQLGVRCVAVLGLSFKPGTDDLRESPVIGLIRDLWQDGIDVLVHDPDVRPEEMLGSNREYLERQLPQINQILRPAIQDVLDNSEVVIVSQKRSEFTRALEGLNGQVSILDLVRLSEKAGLAGVSKYQGISW